MILTTEQDEAKNIMTFINRGFIIDKWYVKSNGRIVFILMKKIEGDKPTDEINKIMKEIINGMNEECKLLEIYERVNKQIFNIAQNNRRKD